MSYEVNSDYEYNAAGRLLLLTHSALTQLIAGYEYALDRVGNRTTLTETLLTGIEAPLGTYLEQDGLVVLEAERYSQLISGTTHTWAITTTMSGFNYPAYLHALPDIDALYQTGAITGSPAILYHLRFTTPGTYTLWGRAYADSGDADSVHVELNQQQQVRLTGFQPEQWAWANVRIGESANSEAAQLSVETAGVYTLTVQMREDGLRLDRLLLTTDTTYIPSELGPEPSTRQRGNTVINYAYDDLYRLTNADYSTGETYAYGYDPVGNRLQQIIDGDTTEYLYDAANRLEMLNSQPVYSFDDNGNLLNSDTLTNTWDAANQLIASERDGTTVQPIYNGVNDRVGQTVGLSTTNFALDVAAGLPEVIYTSEGDAYLHLPGVIMTESSTGEVRYLLSDGLGSVRQAVDETAAVTAYYEFDPYGNPVNNNGGDPYGYTGEWYEGYTDLLHLRARWYLPESGTFLSVDPVESEPPYLYVYGNPIRYLDPSGYQGGPWEETVKIIRNWVCGGWLSVNECPVDTLIRVAGILPSPSKVREEIQEPDLSTLLLINPEDAEEIRQALDAINTAADLAPLLSQLDNCLNPNDIRYSQETYTADPRLRNDTGEWYSVEENVVELINNPDKELPPIRVFIKEPHMDEWRPAEKYGYEGDPKNLENGRLYTLDHGRLVAYRKAGRDTIPVRIATEQEIRRDIFKFSTPNYGTEIFPKKR